MKAIPKNITEVKDNYMRELISAKDIDIKTKAHTATSLSGYDYSIFKSLISPYMWKIYT